MSAGVTMDISKDLLPRQFRWVLKASDIEGALLPATRWGVSLRLAFCLTSPTWDAALREAHAKQTDGVDGLALLLLRHRAPWDTPIIRQGAPLPESIRLEGYVYAVLRDAPLARHAHRATVRKVLQEEVMDVARAGAFPSWWSLHIGVRAKPLALESLWESARGLYAEGSHHRLLTLEEASAPER